MDWIPTERAGVNGRQSWSAYRLLSRIASRASTTPSMRAALPVASDPKLPYSFEQNRGQAHPDVLYRARGDSTFEDVTDQAGVGVLEARVPEEVGQARWPLVIRRLDVQVRVVGDLDRVRDEGVDENRTETDRHRQRQRNSRHQLRARDHPLDDCSLRLLHDGRLRASAGLHCSW